MRVALTHPEHGYYRRPDIFGEGGDFYTAEQVQPAFGLLLRRAVERLVLHQDGRDLLVLGPGRGGLRPYWTGWHVHEVDLDGMLPHSITGLVFSNEFFDALPVHVLVRTAKGWRERYVGWHEGSFVWQEHTLSDPALTAHLPDQPIGTQVEIGLDAYAWLKRIDAVLVRGYVLTIDYGYDIRELPRLASGTLMSYRRHRASSDVLAAPGEQDITAHVNFTQLRTAGEELGWTTVWQGSLQRFLLEQAGEEGMAEVLAVEGVERIRRSLQLKTLLHGMGETFRVLLQRKA